MTVTEIARGLASGVLLMNAVPHGVHGVSGRRFPSPFGTPPGRGRSSPLSNVVWSGVNAAGGLLLRRPAPSPGERAAQLAGAAAMACFLAVWFGGVLGDEDGTAR